MTDTTFGHRLFLERKSRAMNQDDFGALGGVRRLTQHLYETDARVPDLAYLMGLEAAGVDVVYLMRGHREARSNANHISIPANQLTEAYRLADEYGIDQDGKPLPLDVRVRMFQLVVSSLCVNATAENLDLLRHQLAVFSHAQA